MPTKRELADRAYETQEDQRALAIVLQCADHYIGGAFNDRERLLFEIGVASKAIERVRARLVITPPAPKPEPSVPGQINLLDGSVESCPKCGAGRWQWAALMLAGELGEEPKLQCGNCALVVVTTWTQYNAIVAERRRQHSHMDTVKSPVVPERVKRTRGAG